jgi:4-diphosphocytidyl-2C-methyl-D-erythritol kinase
VGSDIYLAFSGNWEPGAYSTRRYALQVRAYESTTARGLGTETGYSKERREESALSVEEAANAAVENVLSRIQSYWQRDLHQGIQYKVIADFSEEWDAQELENLQFSLEDALEEISRRLKEQVLTGHTLEVSVWCDPREFSGSGAVYRALKREFDRRAPDALLGRVSLNRKLLLLTVDPQ